MWHQIGPYVVALAVLGFVVWRNGRSQGRRVRLRAIWIIPVLLTLILLLVLWRAPPPLSLAVLVGFPLALGLGLALGWLRARHLHLRVDPATGWVLSRATPFGMILLVALFAARFVLKLYLPSTPKTAHLAGVAMLWTDLGLIFSAGLVWGRAVTLLQRIRPLLAVHRAGFIE